MSKPPDDRYHAELKRQGERIQKLLNGRYEEIGPHWTDRPITDHECEVCGGIGYVLPNVGPDHPWFNKPFPCPANCEANRENQERRAQTLIKNAGLPSGYQGYRLSQWVDMNPQALEGKRIACSAASLFIWADGHRLSIQEIYASLDQNVPAEYPAPFLEKTGLVFFGDYGVGKTALAAAIVNGLAERGQIATFIRLADAIQEVQATYNRDSERSQREVMQVFQECPVLVLDDFNMENYTNDRREIVEQIIRARGNAERPTVITCNINQTEARKAWGQRTAEILVERYHWIGVGGVSLRPQTHPLF